MPDANQKPVESGNRETLLARRQVQTRVPVSIATLWRWRKSNKFPQPDRKIGNLDFWYESTIDAFIAGEWVAQASAGTEGDG